MQVTESGRETVLAALRPMLIRFDRVAEAAGPQAQAQVVAYLRAVAAEMRAFAADGPNPPPYRP